MKVLIMFPVRFFLVLNPHSFIRNIKVFSLSTERFYAPTDQDRLGYYLISHLNSPVSIFYLLFKYNSLQVVGPEISSNLTTSLIIISASEKALVAFKEFRGEM